MLTIKAKQTLFPYTGLTPSKRYGIKSTKGNKLKILISDLKLRNLTNIDFLMFSNKYGCKDNVGNSCIQYLIGRSNRK